MAADRTTDFAQLCRQYTASKGGADLHKLVHTPLQENAQFNTAASDISKEVYQASKRLQQLTRLVRQNNMFNDPTEAINELAALVKKDITDINMQLDNIQEYMNSKRQLAPSRQAAKHSDAIVSLMKSNLMATTKGFKDILEVRQENMKLQQSRRARYGKTASSALGKPLAFKAPQPTKSNNSHISRNLQEVDLSSTLPRPGFSTGGSLNKDNSEIQPLITTMTQEQIVTEQQNYTESRAEAVSQIESHIVDIGQLFGRLSTLIHEQGDLVRRYSECSECYVGSNMCCVWNCIVVGRIDDNVEDSLVNVSSGEQELLKYFSSLSNTRLLALKISAILLIFLIFFMFFLA